MVKAPMTIIVALIITTVLALLFAVASYVAIRVLRAVLCGFVHMFRGAPGTDRGPLPGRPRPESWAKSGPATNVCPVCPNERCRHVNPPGAKFCAQCGQRV